MATVRAGICTDSKRASSVFNVLHYTFYAIDSVNSQPVVAHYPFGTPTNTTSVLTEYCWFVPTSNEVLLTVDASTTEYYFRTVVMVKSSNKNTKRRKLSDGDAVPVIQEPATPNDEDAILVSDGRYRNKQRCLVLCSRGVTARYRHLLEDLRTLIPHHKKESKLDPGDAGAGHAVNDIAEMRSCNSYVFLECRKHRDAYLWLGRPSGPSAKFHLTNIHTMDELKLTGNCMRNSRPVLSFDESFENFQHLKLLKEIFIDVFGTPRGHPKSKPFVDRVMAFYYADGRVRGMNDVFSC